VKKIFIVAVILLFIGAIANAQVDPECKKKLEETFAKGKILVLKIGGIPTMVQEIPGNLGQKTYTWILIKPGKDWKVKSFLFQKEYSTNVREEREVLSIYKSDIGKKAVKIWTLTERALPYDATGRESWLGSNKPKGVDKHANFFEFVMPDKWDCETAMTAIEKYFEIHDSKEEMSEAKEIKLGMTIEEVEKILGKPQKKADMGSKIVYKYEDTVVTFVDGVVSDIDFR